VEFLRAHTASLVRSRVQNLAHLLKIDLFAWFLLLFHNALRILTHRQLLLWILVWILNDHVLIKMAHRIIYALQILNRNCLCKTFWRRVVKTLLLVGLHLLFHGYLLPCQLQFTRDLAGMLTKHNWIRLNPGMMPNSDIVAVLCQSLFVYSHLQRFMVFCGSCLLGRLLFVATVSFICLWRAQLLMLFYLDGVSVNAVGVHFIGRILFQM
jgi:hypothetical protein